MDNEGVFSPEVFYGIQSKKPERMDLILAYTERKPEEKERKYL